MKLTCPDCRVEIPLADVNVAADVALCRQCGKNFSYAELVTDGDVGEVDLTRPPRGAWFQRKPKGFIVGSSTKSAVALFLVPFVIIWAGGSLGGIYGTQIAKGEFDLKMSLLGLPFLFGTIVIGSFALLSLCGRIEVRVNGEAGEIFTGAGPLGIRRRFRWSREARITRDYMRTKHGGHHQIYLHDGDKRLYVISGVKEERMNFVLAALRQMKREYP